MTISKQAGILADYAAYLAGKNERTVEAYLRALRQFLAWLAEQPGHGPDFQPAHLSRTALEIYLAELRKGDYSLSHQARVKSAVSGFARWLIEEKSLLQRNPTRGIKLPPEPLRAPRQLNDDQRFVLQQLVEKANDVRGAAIFALGYWAGCRVSDVSHLKMANTYVNRKIGWLRVGYKGEKLREIDLVNAARRPLNDYLQSQGRQNSASAYVFISQRSQRLSEAGIHHWFRKLKARAPKAEWELIHDIAFHDLRHDFAHRARQRGWSLEELAYYLGHVTQQGLPAIQTTMRYTQVSRDDIKHKLKLLED